MRKYTLGFDMWGLILFLSIMIPNFIWFVLPAPNDILRAGSVSQEVDSVASVCQVIMAAALCMVKNKEREKIRLSPAVIAVIACCVVYYAAWVMYYCAVVSSLVILALTIAPCAAFILFSAYRKNRIALTAAVIFAVCHLYSAVVNYIA